MQITQVRREKGMGIKGNKDSKVESERTREYEKAREWNCSWKFRKNFAFHSRS